MGRRLTFAQVSDPALPRIEKGRFIYGHDFTHRCKGRGATGHGYSAMQAWKQWEKNWKRLHAWYKAREEEAVATLNRVEADEALTARERNHGKCKHCGRTDLHWRDRGDGWKLYENEKEHPGNRYPLHQCATSAEGFDDVPVL